VSLKITGVTLSGGNGFVDVAIKAPNGTTNLASVGFVSSSGSFIDVLTLPGGNHAAKNDAWGRNLAEALPPEIPIVRPALSGGFQNAAIGNRNRGVNQTADVYRDGVTGLQNSAASKSIASSQQYSSDMKVAIDRQAGGQIAGVNAGAGEAIGGYQRGAAQARSGVDQNYRLELGANKQIYVTQVDAAGQIRNAGLEAAKLRQAAAVIAAVGREISREVGQGMRIRF
jgi:hypothetical protein